MSHHAAIAVAVVAALGTLGACERVSRAPDNTSFTQPSGPVNDTGPSIVVSIPPQAYFVERIAPDGTAVHVLAGPGQSPATYDPSPTQIATLSAADVYFRIGVPFEKQLIAKLATLAPGLRVVDTREGITLRRVEGHEHRHGDSEVDEQGLRGEHDPHIWLDPRLAQVQARSIADEVKRIAPNSAAVVDQRLAVLLSELDALDGEIRAILRPLQGESIYVFHPAFGYFTDAYGLRQVPIETGGKEPSPQQLASLIEEAGAAGAKTIFVQPEFSSASAEAVARHIGADVVPIDPLSRDYMTNLRRMAAAISTGLSGSAGVTETVVR